MERPEDERVTLPMPPTFFLRRGCCALKTPIPGRRGVGVALACSRLSGGRRGAAMQRETNTQRQAQPCGDAQTDERQLAHPRLHIQCPFHVEPEEMHGAADIGMGASRLCFEELNLVRCRLRPGHLRERRQGRASLLCILLERRFTDPDRFLE